METKHPVYIMMFGVVTSEGNIILSLSLSPDLKRVGSCLKALCLATGLCAISRKQENQVRKFLQPHYPYDKAGLQFTRIV